MFMECKQVRQIPGEPKRRWFSGKGMELIVWYADEENIFGFQLCYDFGADPRALTWTETSGFFHSGIDDGENFDGMAKQTPILVPDGIFDNQELVPLFLRESKGLPDEIAELVRTKCLEYEPKGNR